MHIILTGDKETGKSAVALNLVRDLQSLGHKPYGFVTIKYGWGLLLYNINGGPPIVLALTEPEELDDDVTQVGRYHFINESVRLGLHILRWPGDVLIVDEIGNWETLGGGFARAFDIINNSTVRHSLVVVRKSVLPKVVQYYHREPMIIQVTKENKGQLAEAICRRFNDLLSQQSLEEHLNQ